MCDERGRLTFLILVGPMSWIGSYVACLVIILTVCVCLVILFVCLLAG